MASCTHVFVLWLVLKLVSGFIMPMVKPGGEPDFTSVVNHVTLLEQTMRSFQMQIENSNRQMMILTNDLTAAKQELNNMKTGTKSDVSRIVQGELNTTKDELNTLESQLQDTRQELGSTKTKLRKAVLHIDLLTSEITSKFATLEEDIYYINSNLSQRIDQTGKDVAFQVSQSTSKAGWTTLNFDTVDYNLGGGYNPTSGYFTAPVSGTYVIWVNVLFTSSDGEVLMFKNSKVLAKGAGYASGAGVNYNTASVTAVVYLNIGDTSHFTVDRKDCTIDGGRFSHLGGTLIHVGSDTI